MLGCVIMAAGNAVRFGANKLEAELDGKPLIRRAFEAVPAGVFDRVAVVTQYPAVAALAREFGFEPVRNDRPGDGLSRTVRLGTQALAQCDGIVFLVADQPLLSASAVRAVVRQWREHPSCIVGAACGTRRGNPNLFPREFFPALCALEGDRGGSAVIRQYPERYLAVDVPPEALADVDTPEALRAIRDTSVGNGIQQIENGKGTGKSCAHPPVVRCRGVVCFCPANYIS